MAIPLQAPHLDITRHRRRPGEQVIVALLLLCAVAIFVRNRCFTTRW